MGLTAIKRGKWQPSRRYQFRGPPWLAMCLIFCLGGPLNPAAWLMLHLDLRMISPDLYHDFAVVILLPCCVMALSCLFLLQKHRGTYSLVEIVGYSAAGFGVAVFLAPITLIVGGALFLGSSWSLNDIVGGILFYYFFGWLLLVIPYFAAVYGVPCAVAFALVVFALMRRVRD